LSNSVYSAFDTIGRPDVSARLQLTRLAGLSLCIFPVAYLLHDLRDIAITRFLVTVAVAPALFLALGRVLQLRMRDFVATLWRPLVAGLAMAAVVSTGNIYLPFTGPLRLVLDIGVGSAVFAVDPHGSLVCQRTTVRSGNRGVELANEIPVGRKFAEHGRARSRGGAFRARCIDTNSSRAGTACSFHYRIKANQQNGQSDVDQDGIYCQCFERQHKRTPCKIKTNLLTP